MDLVGILADKCLSLFHDPEWLEREVAMIGGRMDVMIDEIKEK